MNYENMPCPGCGSHLHTDDDVVVCPVCATPQHRACWLENGKCVNDDKHTSGYVWTSGNGEFGVIQTETGPKICPICKSENPSDAVNCNSCGAFFGYQVEKGNEMIKCLYCGAENDESNIECSNCSAPLKNISQADRTRYFGDSGETIGEIPADKMAMYVKVSNEKYLKKFRKLENGKKVSFNWAAFFFGPLWYFFRKVYKVGIVLCIVLAAASVIFNSCASEVSEILTPYEEQIQTNTLSQEEIMAIAAEMRTVTAKPFAIGMTIIFFTNLTGAFLADSAYLKKIKTDFKVLDEQVPDENMKVMLMQRRGGISLLGVVCGVFMYESIGSLAVCLADFIASRL